jgi:hypothetical protein
MARLPQVAFDRTILYLRGAHTSRTALMICLHDMRTGTCHKSAYLSANLHLLSFNIDRFPSTLSSLSVSLLLFFILIPQLADVVVVYLLAYSHLIVIDGGGHTDELPSILPDVVEIAGISTECISVTCCDD